MAKSGLHIPALVIYAVWISACGLIAPTTSGLRIEFKAGDYRGGANLHHLVISEHGVATYKVGFPELSLELPEAKYDSIYAQVVPLYVLTRTEYFPERSGFDVLFAEIHVGSKVFRGDQSYIYESRDQFQAGAVDRAIRVLSELANYTYLNAAPWIGLEFDAAPEQATYTAGDTIRVQYHLSNPTNLIRSVPFPHQSQVRLRVTGGDCSGVCYLEPPYTFSDETPPSIILLPPGDEWLSVLKWPQPYTNDDGFEVTLQPGGYRLSMSMLNGRFKATSDSIWVVGP